MPQTFTPPDIGTQLQRFAPTDTAIAAMRDAYMPLVIHGVEDAEGFKAVHEGRMVCKQQLTAVEKTRKALKQESLDYGRRVDGEAKRIVGLLQPVYDHLESEESVYNQARELIRNAAKIKAETEAAAAKAAEEDRIKAEHAAETERLRVEAAKLAVERAAMEAERAKIVAEQQRLAGIESARLRTIEDARIAVEAARRARVETEARIVREAAAKEAAIKARSKAEETARLRAEALRPDKEKLLSVADAVLAIVVPAVSPQAEGASCRVRQLLIDAASNIRRIVERMAAEVGQPCR